MGMKIKVFKPFIFIFLFILFINIVLLSTTKPNYAPFTDASLAKQVYNSTDYETNYKQIYKLNLYDKINKFEELKYVDQISDLKINLYNNSVDNLKALQYLDNISSIQIINHTNKHLTVDLSGLKTLYYLNIVGVNVSGLDKNDAYSTSIKLKDVNSFDFNWLDSKRVIDLSLIDINNIKCSKISSLDIHQLLINNVKNLSLENINDAHFENIVLENIEKNQFQEIIKIQSIRNLYITNTVNFNVESLVNLNASVIIFE